MRKRILRIGFVFVIGLASTLMSRRATACSTCQCGDPTLTVMGTELPFAGRTRFGLEYRFRTEEVGATGTNQASLRENRALFIGSYSPNPLLTLGASFPLLSKRLTKDNGSKDETFGPGDLRLSSRFRLLDFFSGESENLFGLTVGLRIPTAQKQKDNGQVIDIDAQLGTGAWVPNAGLWYSRFDFPFYFYLSSTVHVPTEGWDEFQAGEAVLSTARAQYQWKGWLSFAISVDTRWATKDREAGITDQDSGGFMAFLTPGFLFQPWQDLLVSLNIFAPVLNRLNGSHDEGLMVSMGITYDF